MITMKTYLPIYLECKFLKILYLMILSLFIISCGGGGSKSDVIPPVIQVLGINPVTIMQGENYNDAGAIATDNVDNNVTVISSGTVNTSIANTYIITYNATDKAGNTAIPKTRHVIVKASLTGIEGIMQNALLVERVKTQSTVNLQAIANLKSGGIVDGFATWSEYDSNAKITRRYAINTTGEFYVGAEGDAEAVLSVLTQKGISTAATWGYSVAKDDVIHPDLNLDIRTNALASSLYENFVAFMDTAGMITSSNKLKLVYAKPYGKERGKAVLNFEDLEFGLQNKMGSKIKVLSSALIMRQMDTRWACRGCPFNGIAFRNGPNAEIHHALNKKWNPKATDETNGSGTRSFNLQVAGKKIFYTARVDGDNRNSGEISIDNSVVEAFSNWDADNHIYTRADHAPSSVKMRLNNNWSVSEATFRIAVLDGDITFSNKAQTPVTGMSKNPSPLVLTINTGWTIVEETIDSSDKKDTIIYTVETGSLININDISTAVPSYSVTVHGDTATWEQPFWDSFKDNGRYGSKQIVQGELTISFTVNKNGNITAQTKSADKDDHLFIFSMGRGTYVDSLMRDGYDPIKTNWLYIISKNLYWKLKDKNLLSGNILSDDTELLNRHMSQKNYFSKDITIVMSRLAHHQMDYSWFNEEANGPWQRADNAKWSPIASNPDQNANISRSFDIHTR